MYYVMTRDSVRRHPQPPEPAGAALYIDSGGWTQLSCLVWSVGGGCGVAPPHYCWHGSVGVWGGLAGSSEALVEACLAGV